MAGLTFLLIIGAAGGRNVSARKENGCWWGETLFSALSRAGGCYEYIHNFLFTVWDPEVGRINPSEHKQLKLARSLTRGIIDRDLKPSSSERKSIQRISKYPPTRILSGDERQVLWKFHFSLMSEKRALTKFLRCVESNGVMFRFLEVAQ
ncbi:hypothetical protein LOK49_LG05G02091 [Camellia lanceoleosa]|uniref:Uncharacterized protein n=1 Tax=Camellia lanceoleosa TaxID=1840588 RepID=A0ACC0HUJ8_9ERIC|nr:hypothetical protein LOK49_LG05G02091 [Camellia lanceoleosa]